jgi:hypothetical protein
VLVCMLPDVVTSFGLQEAAVGSQGVQHLAGQHVHPEVDVLGVYRTYVSL